jgi:hypothetical protein
LNHNLPGAGFKFQTGVSIGLDQYLRLPNESPAFNQSLPGSHLPLPTKSGNASVAATGHGAEIDLGTAVAEGQGGVVNGEATITGHQADANVGTVVARGAGAPAVIGHALSIDAGTPGLAGAANTVQTGHAIAADVGTAVLAGAAVYSANGDQLAADVGTPTIGGAGVAAPGGDVGQADIGSVALSAASNIAASGHELAADVGEAAVSTAYIIGVEDSAIENHAGSPLLVLANGDAFPAGVEAQAIAGTAVAAGAGVLPVAKPHGRRRPVVWEWPVVKEKLPEVLPVVENAKAFPRGVAAAASVGRVRVNGTARVIPMSAFGRSQIGIVAAEVDYKLRDQQEEEFIQLLLAA